MKKYKGIC